MGYQWINNIKQYELYTASILEEIISVANTVSQAACPTNCSAYCSTNDTSDCYSDYISEHYGYGGGSGYSGDNSSKFSGNCVNAYYSGVNNSNHRSKAGGGGGGGQVCDQCDTKALP